MNKGRNTSFGEIKQKKGPLAGRLLGLIILILVMLTVTFTGSIMLIASRSEHDYGIKESEIVINNMRNNIESNMDYYNDISRLIMLNNGVRGFLRDEEDTQQLSNDAKDGILSVLHVCNNIDSVYIFSNSGKYVSTAKGEYTVDYERMKSEEWKNIILEKKGGAVICMNANNAVFKRNGVPIVTIARAIYDIYTQKQTGILLINILQSMFVRILQDGGTSDVCVVTNEGRLLAGNGELADMYTPDFAAGGIVYKTMRKSTEHLTISGCAIEKTPFVVMCSVKANIFVVPQETIISLIILLAAFIGIMITVGYFVEKNITHPIKDLAAAMDLTRGLERPEKINVDMPYREMEMLSDSYNSVVEHLNDTFARLIENEKTVQKAEMRVLHEQIKPHFLYNSLETISYMALSSGAEDVHSALETLGSFYRNFLSKGDREIPLRREICIIRDYLDLQKLRYDDIITDEYCIDENTNDCMIPKLILQPLVENSIYHGIRQKGEPGVIRITSRLENNDLHIIVYDNGVGMSQEEIEKNLAIVRSDDSANILSGFGLKGTIDRIRYYCNNDDAVQIRSEVGEYTEIEIIIPKMG